MRVQARVHRNMEQAVGFFLSKSYQPSTSYPTTSTAKTLSGFLHRDTIGQTLSPDIVLEVQSGCSKPGMACLQFMDVYWRTKWWTPSMAYSSTSTTAYIGLCAPDRGTRIEQRIRVQVVQRRSAETHQNGLPWAHLYVWDARKFCNDKPFVKEILHSMVAIALVMNCARRLLQTSPIFCLHVS